MSTRFLPFLPGALVIGALTGHIARAEPVTPRHLVAAQPATLAGVVYDPSVSLSAITTPFFDVHDPPTGARTFRVLYKGAAEGVVPALLTVPGNGRGRATRYPAVVLVHGLGGRKEDTVLLAVALARRGYATLAIDLPAHGERQRRDGRGIADLTLEETRHVGAVAVADLRRGVDYLCARPDIDASRVGCVGISLGGIIGGVFAGVEPRVRATALWSAGGDWGKLLMRSDHPFALARRERGGFPGEQAVENVLRDIDPLTYASRIAPRPLLLLAGTDDDVVPNICTDELYAAAGEPKNLIRYRGGHIPDPRAMTMRTMEFFDVRLKRGK